jgi:hypothetical protein
MKMEISGILAIYPISQVNDYQLVHVPMTRTIPDLNEKTGRLSVEARQRLTCLKLPFVFLRKSQAIR